MRAAIAIALISATVAIAADPAFEVASVRRADPDARGYSCSGGPQTSTPERYSCAGAALSALICEAYGKDAYGLQFYQVEGLPDWANRGGPDGYAISANVPAGATQAQFRLMLQSLLKERFGLEATSQKLPRGSWFLVSNGKPRLVPSAPDTQRSVQPQYKNNRMHLVMTHQPMDVLAGYMTTVLRASVTNETGLKGEYDFTLDFAPEWAGPVPIPLPADDSIPGLASAVNQQLGLKLEHRIVPQDVVVVTRVNRDPGAN